MRTPNDLNIMIIVPIFYVTPFIAQEVPGDLGPREEPIRIPWGQFTSQFHSLGLDFVGFKTRAQARVIWDTLYLFTGRAEIRGVGDQALLGRNRT